MTGREIVKKAIRREATPRAAWVPYVGAHGAALIGRSAEEYLKSADLMVEGLSKAVKLYRPDGLPVMFDLQVEAENLGCNLHWSKDGPPSVTSHPLAGTHWKPKDIADLDLSKGRIPLCMEVARRMRMQHGDNLALYGLICGPFTLALHLLGTDIFLEMFDREEEVAALVSRCAQIGKQMAGAYLKAGCDVIAVVDPMISQISPEHFERFVAPAMNDLYDFIRLQGGLSSCFVCGDATRILENMCRTTCDSVSVDEQIDMSRMRDIAAANNTSFGGNLKLTVVLLMGSEADAKLNAIHTLDASGSCGFILSPGCDLPFHVKPENVAAAGLMALDSYQRETARATCKATTMESFDDIVLPDYKSLPTVILDVVTLDSETCAPCQYMKAAADQAAEKFPGKVEVREHKITCREGVGMLVKLGVSNLPTLCIDGEARHNSLIPDHKTLAEEIRLKIASKSRSA